MINRQLIRLKVVQVVYAYYANPGKTVDEAEDELFDALERSYDLYHQLLMLMCRMGYVIERQVETIRARARRLGTTDHTGTRLTANKFMAQLRENRQLREFADKHNRIWDEQDDLLRRLWRQLQERDFYVDYDLSQERGYEEDRELWRKVFRHMIIGNEDIDEVLEDECMWWNDDRLIVDTFVLKTIKRFDPALGADQPLLPDFASHQDRLFASLTLRNALTNAEYYRELIAQQMQNWDMERMPRFDLVVQQVALAEIFNFPAIPLGVSINEYVELAKAYSTPRSGAYVNAVLDAVCHQLIESGELVKNTTNEEPKRA